MASDGRVKAEPAAARGDETALLGAYASTSPIWPCLIPVAPGLGRGESSRKQQACFVPSLGAAAPGVVYSHPPLPQSHLTEGLGQGFPFPSVGVKPFTPLYSLGLAAGSPSSSAFENIAGPYSPSYPFDAAANVEQHPEQSTFMYNPEEAGIISSRYLIREKIVVGQPLHEIDTRSLSAKQVLFYFGVLTLKEPCLQPSFEYVQDRSSMWTAKLVLYRESISIPRMLTRMGAKVEICRVALSLLKPRFASWRVPDEPSLDLTAPEWLWGSLLEDYAYVNQLPCPVFTRYVHKNGYRYEVEVGAVRGWGSCKFYRTDADAADAAAHQALYQLLTEGCDELAVSVPAGEPAQMEAPMSKLRVPARNGMASMDVKTEHALDPSYDDKQEGSRLSKQEKKRRRGVVSNLVPLQNARIPTLDCKDEPEPQSKWKITRHDLLKELRPLSTWVEKVKKMCELLHITPEFSIESTPLPMSTTDTVAQTHAAWATFQDDPYLARAGAIGKVDGIETSETDAKEACCRRVYDYLIDLVDQDTALEAEEREGREFIKNFGEIKRQRLEADGWKFPAPVR
ncbi:hypothetical protein PISL3812_08581 [Talaromyces islandicus]|uniref:Uncharacterized protein n=1 Tax=Talaromyces islandicus TaxID=28573 RepID=A0A0U1M921_TALIS|nr:hypothetical protein PISL3812_08581 [Talaromyces islandicus]